MLNSPSTGLLNSCGSLAVSVVVVVVVVVVVDVVVVPVNRVKSTFRYKQWQLVVEKFGGCRWVGWN